jgi:hypothetical protein
MADTPPAAAPGFNFTTTAVPVAPVPGPGGTKGAPSASTTGSRTRVIAPPTTYNPDTGLLEPVKGGWTGKDDAPDPKVAKPKADASAKPEPTRQEKWKAEQAAAKAEREAKATKKTAESQALARDFLKKGDLPGAAKALGMPAAELRDLLVGGLLTTPTEDKPLTPEQEREARDEKYRKDVEALKKEQLDFKNSVVRASYIKDKIVPAITDAEKFAFLHDEGLEKSAAYIYDFMNEHYQRTFRETGKGEELNAADVAETMEKQLEANYRAGIERLRKIKKMKALFGEVEEPAPAEEPDLEQPAPATEEEPAPEEEPLAAEPANAQPPPRRPAPPRQVSLGRAAIGSGVPFALLTREERLARMDAENRAARRA